jgi:hypothetical protein
MRTVQRQDGRVAVELWRDPDVRARNRPGMALGRAEVAGDWAARAAEFTAAGARAVRIGSPVVLCGPDAAGSAGALALIREFTARGVAVEWTARCRPGCDDHLLHGHLWPPARVLRGTESTTVTADWRARFFPAKCVFRRGPGFLEVRDRRWGRLELYTVDDPEWIAAVRAMTEGAPASAVPPAAREAFATARLTAGYGERLWWLPYQIRRWPFPPLLV